MSSMTTPEIIELLGGVTSVARLLNIKPPSVHAWLQDGIPQGRLVELAAQIESKSNGRFSRRKHWPERYAFYWPELAQPQAAPAPYDEHPTPSPTQSQSPSPSI